MAINLKIVQCAECGSDMSVGSNTHKARHCMVCSEARYIRNLASLVSKSGPEYEANVKATRAYHARKARGGGWEEELSESEDSA